MRKFLFNQVVVLLYLLVILAYPVFAEPILLVTPESIDFGEIEPYSTTVVTEQINIANCGDGVLCWEITANNGWLSVEGNTSGEINLPDGDDKYVQESLGACGLCIVLQLEDEDIEDIIGTHPGSFTVTQYNYNGVECTTAVIDSVTVTAKVTISEFNVLEVDTGDPENPNELDFGTDLDEKELYIRNAGQGEMEWEVVVSEGADWLTIDDGTSTSGTTGTSEYETIKVEVDRSKVEGCAEGYIASIVVTSTNASPSEVSVSVIMQRDIQVPEPNSPTPADGATDQPLYTTLEWDEGESVEGIVYFDVYFDTNQALVDSFSPSVLVCEDIEDTYCEPSEGRGPLDANTKYYWKVRAVDECQDDNTVDSETWSFTTGSEPEPTCPASMALQLNDREITTLRRFRDEVLVRSFAGERYVTLYYSPYTIEALLILLFNPELRVCANRIVKESLPVIQSLLKGEKVSIDTESIVDIELFLEEFGKEASPDLKRAISIIKKDIAKGDLFKGFGFSVVKQ